jgi:predicted secreted protein
LKTLKNGFAAAQKSIPPRRQPEIIMIEDRPLILLLENRKRFDSPLTNHFSSLLQTSLFMKWIITLAGLCFFLMTAPLQGTEMLKPSPAIGPVAQWSPAANAMEKIRADCTPLAGAAFEACFIDGMQKSGASVEAVAFAKSIGNMGYMQAFRPFGPVDIALVVYPFRANENQGFLLINGNPPQIDVDDLDLLSPEDLKKDPGYHRLKRKYPAVTLWHGDRSDTEYPLEERTPEGGQRFIVRYRLLNGCHACELAGMVRYAFTFDRTGQFLGTTCLGIEKSPADRSLNEVVFSDPARPVSVRVGQTFTLKLRSNPTTGYMWKVAEPFSEGIIRFIGREYQAKKTDRVGAGGMEIWTFRAVGMGETLIGLKYVRPWEKDTAPAETVTFKVFSGGNTKGKSISH